MNTVPTEGGIFELIPLTCLDSRKPSTCTCYLQSSSVRVSSLDRFSKKRDCQKIQAGLCRPVIFACRSGWIQASPDVCAHVARNHLTGRESCQLGRTQARVVKRTSKPDNILGNSTCATPIAASLRNEEHILSKLIKNITAQVPSVSGHPRLLLDHPRRYWRGPASAFSSSPFHSPRPGELCQPLCTENS